MQQTILQLSQTDKQLKEEQSSLVMAIRTIQNHLNQQGNSNKKSSEAREETGGGINENMWKKPKSKHQSKRSTSLLTNSGEGSKHATGDIKLKNQYDILTDKNLESASLSSDTSLGTYAL